MHLRLSAFLLGALCVSGCQTSQGSTTEHSVLTIEDRRYALFTRVGAGRDGSDTYFLHARNQLWECEAPTAEGCAGALRRVNRAAEQQESASDNP